jgi:hypothetical protein
MEFDGGDIVAIILASGSAFWHAVKEFVGRSDKKRFEKISEFDIEVRSLAEQVLSRIDSNITDFDVLRRGTLAFPKAKKEAVNLTAMSRRVASEASRMLNKFEFSHAAIATWIELDDPFRDEHAKFCDAILAAKSRSDLDIAIAHLVECESIFAQRVRERLATFRKKL